METKSIYIIGLNQMNIFLLMVLVEALLQVSINN